MVIWWWMEGIVSCVCRGKEYWFTQRTLNPPAWVQFRCYVGLDLGTARTQPVGSHFSGSIYWEPVRSNVKNVIGCGVRIELWTGFAVQRLCICLMHHRHSRMGCRNVRVRMSGIHGIKPTWPTGPGSRADLYIGPIWPSDPACRDLSDQQFAWIRPTRTGFTTPPGPSHTGTSGTIPRGYISLRVYIDLHDHWSSMINKRAVDRHWPRQSFVFQLNPGPQ